MMLKNKQINKNKVAVSNPDLEWKSHETQKPTASGNYLPASLNNQFGITTMVGDA